MQLTEKFVEALAYASEAHQSQKRKGTDIPYVAHLLGVASIALEHGANEDEAVAALLHDAVEDAGGKPRLEDIRRRFGQDVAKIVEGCTDADTIPKPPWRERREAYLRHIAGASASVRLVSASDKLHNARAILNDYRKMGDELWSRFNGGKEGTLWYYRSLVQAFQRAEPNDLVNELDRVVTELARLAMPDQAGRVR
jgi:(p)ppGpp synthase/HD superfamily hydrolase